MSRILDRARQQAWADRAEHGRNTGPARDRWCVNRLMRIGAIVPAHHSAAVRYSSLLERAAGQAASGGPSEQIDGGGHDPHARMFDRSLCAREAECARMSVLTRMAGPHRPLRVAIFEAATGFPHLSVSAAMQAAGMSVNGREQRAFIAHLADSLDLLTTYFDAVDADLEKHKRALDGAVKSKHGFS